jgi:pimeloyl-ACP methyl ester carboxylesterase
MQLAGTDPERVRAVVAIAGHPFGYRMSEEEMAAVVEARNRRAAYIFGAPGDPPSFEPWSVERENQIFSRWALSELGILERITQPLLMINGKRDHLAPIGNIYSCLSTARSWGARRVSIRTMGIVPSNTTGSGVLRRSPGSARSSLKGRTPNKRVQMPQWLKSRPESAYEAAAL